MTGKDTPREFTEEEVRTMFLEHVWTMIGYWEKESRVTDLREKLAGVAFSILVALDGESYLPGFVVSPHPHPDDKEFHRNEGENWFPESDHDKVKCDIAGGLHDHFHKLDPLRMKTSC